MAKLRRVRRDFRKEVLQLVNAGEGNFETLMELAERSFRDAGYHELLRTFWTTEVHNAVSYLRDHGDPTERIESIGKKWKPASELTVDDVEVISTRRKKRLRGELKAEVRLAHGHGRTEEAVLASKMLDLISQSLPQEDAVPETVTAPPVE